MLKALDAYVVTKMAIFNINNSIILNKFWTNLENNLDDASQNGDFGELDGTEDLNPLGKQLLDVA